MFSSNGQFNAAASDKRISSHFLKLNEEIMEKRYTYPLMIEAITNNWWSFIFKIFINTDDVIEGEQILCIYA